MRMPILTLMVARVCHAYCRDHDLLQPRCLRADDDEIRVFKAELRQALADPGQLPEGELHDSVEYGDGDDAAFCGGSGAICTARSHGHETPDPIAHIDA